MSDLPEYKGYNASVKINFNDNEFYGHIEGIKDLVNFISDCKEGVPGIIREFHSAVDDYIEFCHEHCIAPKIPEYIQERELAVSL